MNFSEIIEKIYDYPSKNISDLNFKNQIRYSVSKLTGKFENSPFSKIN